LPLFVALLGGSLCSAFVSINDVVYSERQSALTSKLNTTG